MTGHAGFDDTMGLYRVFTLAGLALMFMGLFAERVFIGAMISLTGYLIVGAVLGVVSHQNEFTRIDPPPLLLVAAIWPLLYVSDRWHNTKWSEGND